MKVLVDTNVVIDEFLKREPFYKDSHSVLQMCSDNKIEGYLAAHTITNAFYILRKNFSNKKSRELVLDLFKTFNVESINTSKLIRALISENFSDFEDRLQVECAIAVDADYIITRDKNDFADSEISCITPAEFCSMLDE